MTDYLTFVIIDQRIVLYQCKTKTVKSLSELFRCDKCNFHRKKIQISKPDGGRTQAAKSVTGRQKNDRRGPECPYYVERCKCSRSEHVKRSLNQTPSLPRRKCRIFIWPSSVANQWLGGLWWLHYCIISPPLLRFQIHHRHCRWLWTISDNFGFVEITWLLWHFMLKSPLIDVRVVPSIWTGTTGVAAMVRTFEVEWRVGIFSW